MTRRGIYYDREGKPISLDEYAQRMNGPIAYRIVKKTNVRGVEVSTVWLGIDHNWVAEGPPLIFETMTFGSEADEVGDIQWRYSTEAEALAGHAQAVRLVQDSIRKAGPRPNEPIIPDENRPIADVEPGSIDISGLDKAGLLAAMVNATKLPLPVPIEPMTHERAAAIIQDRLGAGRGRPFDFDYVMFRPIKCDIGGPRISALHRALYDRDAGEGTLARVVDALRAAADRERAARDMRVASEARLNDRRRQ